MYSHKISLFNDCLHFKTKTVRILKEWHDTGRNLEYWLMYFSVKLSGVLKIMVIVIQNGISYPIG